MILVTAHPIFVAPLAHYFLKEPLSKVNIIGITIALVGVILLVYGNYGFSATGINPLMGNFFAFLGGIAAGLYILGGKIMRQQLSTITYAFIVYSVATFFLFIIAILTNSPLTGISQHDILIIILMAIVAGIFGHTLYNWSLAHLRASLASVALLCEPIGSSTLAFIIPWINQIPTTFTILGGVIIFIGIYLTAISKISKEQSIKPDL
jgi:drug/metabolite transporter (DMT)-like permease